MTTPDQPPSVMSGEDWLLWLLKIVAMGKNAGRGEGVPLPANAPPLSDDARLVAEEAARYAEAVLPLLGNLQWRAKEYERVADERLQLCETLRSELWNETQALASANATIARLREALKTARQDMEGWAAYADDYFIRKHNLAGDLAAIDAILAETDTRQALETEERR